jgi:hypothetical protein
MVNALATNRSDPSFWEAQECKSVVSALGSEVIPAAVEGDAPNFVEVGEAGIAVGDAMRHERLVQLVG